MIQSRKENYDSLGSQYTDQGSLMYMKLHLADSLVDGGERLLDIGVGTGEWIDIEKGKFKAIYGIDIDEKSLEICRMKFRGCRHIHLLQGDLEDIADSVGSMGPIDSVNSVDSISPIDSIAHGGFDYVTCLDVLEHIPEADVRHLLLRAREMLRPGGRLLFTGPGVFEKARIAMGRSPTHLHSHSSYGWQRLIRSAGFSIIRTESVQFPVFNSDLLRKRAHLFGKCCVILAEKEGGEKEGGGH